MKILEVRQYGLGCNRKFLVKDKKKQIFWEKFALRMDGKVATIVTKTKWL